MNVKDGQKTKNEYRGSRDGIIDMYEKQFDVRSYKWGSRFETAGVTTV